MNETRKEIISLISDYMDKTLSEGCLLLKHHPNGKIILKYNGIKDNHNKYVLLSKLDGSAYDNLQNYTIYNLLTPMKTQVYKGPKDYNWERTNQDEFTIIGHYDLSALLKTIQSFGLMLVGFDGDCINFYSEANQKNYRILNKPLQLYNTNEEKELLDLLLKLKNDFN